MTWEEATLLARHRMNDAGVCRDPTACAQVRRHLMRGVYHYFSILSARCLSFLAGSMPTSAACDGFAPAPAGRLHMSSGPWARRACKGRPLWSSSMRATVSGGCTANMAPGS